MIRYAALTLCLCACEPGAMKPSVPAAAVGGGGGGLATGGGNAATGGGDATGGGGGGGAVEVDAGVDAGAAVDAGPVVDLCSAAAAPSCVDHDTRHFCGSTPNGLRWLDQACAAGSGCVRGACVVGACSDDCTFGDTDGGLTCRPWSVTGAPATLDAGRLHDRARDYARWLQRDGLAAGGVGSPRYADTTYSQVTYMDGIGDSALWTGTLLAAEALRLQETGSIDARAKVASLIDTLHLWLNVSGSPGNLARYAVRSGTQHPFVVGDLDCGTSRTHCGVQYRGASYDYLGHVSRDQYQGVVLGYALAYDALPEGDPLREVLRADLVTLVKELMTERQVRVSLMFNGVRLPTTTATARFIVVNPAELVNGALDLRVSTSGGDGDMYGFQEFSPDLALLVRQMPGLGWVPAIERPSSAIMLASFFQVALHVTEGAPAWAADRAAILAYYTGHTGPGGNINDWLTIARRWTPGTGCNQTYYSNNITLQPLYNLARLETDPGRRADVHDAVFTRAMWPTFSTTKNPFFSFIYAGTVSGVSPSVASSALAQLSQFPPPPRVHRPVDLRNDARYPHEPGCTDQVIHSSAVDVGERVTGDFLWQRDPWQLYDPGDLTRSEPGVDYLVAYWLGRHHGFIADDTPGVCLVMQ